MNHRRCVFRGNPDPESPEFFEKIMSVIRALAAEGVEFELQSDEVSRASHLHQMTWTAGDGLAELSVVRDTRDGLCYAAVVSRQSWIASRVVSAFGDGIGCYGVDELVGECGRRFFDPELLVALGLTVRRQDPDVVRTISAALDHGAARVRCCAARAAGITGWDVFVPELEMMLKLETDLQAREAAEYALGECAGG